MTRASLGPLNFATHKIVLALVKLINQFSRIDFLKKRLEITAAKSIIKLNRI